MVQHGLNRSAFVIGAAASVLATTARARCATQQMGPLTPFGVPTRAFVARPQLIRQQCAQWCWAASTAMIFAAYGHPISQQAIVAHVFGGTVCQPAGNTLTIARALSDQWTDLNGTPFQYTISAAYDPANGVNNLDNAIIVNELSADRPLLYANTHHAMVVVVADYMRGPNGPNRVDGIGVLDPWPYSPGFHPLSAPEMVPIDRGGQMTFLATIA